MNKDTQVINVADALERVQDDRELFLELLDIFSRDFKDKRQHMEKFMQKNNMEGLRDIAHSLKGAAGNISAEKIYSTCVTLEQSAADNKPVAIPELLGKLDAQYAELQSRIIQIKKEFKGK